MPIAQSRRHTHHASASRMCAALRGRRRPPPLPTSFGPSRFDLEHYPAIATTAAGRSSAVEISRRVPNQAAGGSAPISSASETVQHCQRAGGIQLEHYSVTRRAAQGASTVEIARRVPDQTCGGISAIRSPCEVVKYGLHTGRIHFEYRSATCIDRTVADDAA